MKYHYYYVSGKAIIDKDNRFYDRSIEAFDSFELAQKDDQDDRSFFLEVPDRLRKLFEEAIIAGGEFKIDKVENFVICRLN